MNCIFEDLGWPIVGTVYTCTGILEITGDERNLTTVAGNHTNGRNDSDVSGLSVHDQLLNGIPQNIHEFFPHITALSFSASSIRFLTRSDLENFPNLEYLNLLKNQIWSIDGDVFVVTPLLRYLNLSSNLLRNLGPNVFDSLMNLRILSLLDNACIDRYVYDNPIEIMNLKYEASFRCPSSIQQIERVILEGEAFRNVIDPLASQIEQLQQRVFELENRNKMMKNIK
jgi:hypothetical protein